MKHVIVLMAVGILVLTGGLKAYAEECIGSNGVVIMRDNGCLPHPNGNGGDTPIPFGLNSKVELADGESYILVGKVIINGKKAGEKQARVVLEVDLREHPWLANTKRVRSSSYPLQGSIASWRKYENKTVKLACKAHGHIVNFGYGPEYVISLEGTQMVNERSVR